MARLLNGHNNVCGSAEGLAGGLLCGGALCVWCVYGRDTETKTETKTQMAYCVINNHCLLSAMGFTKYYKAVYFLIFQDRFIICYINDEEI